MHIDSPKNNTIQEWKKLQTTKGRKAQGLFLVEGEHLVHEALKWGTVEVILCREELNARDYSAANAKLITLSERAFAELSSVETNQGVAAIVKIPDLPLDLYIAPRVLALDAVQDPGNVGTLIRTADAAGFSAVLLGEGCADPFAPKTVRSTQGSLFHLPIITCNLPEVLSAWKTANRDGLIVGADGAAQTRYDQWNAPQSACLVMGNEGAGLSPAVRKLCDCFLSIPIHGKAESLSVSIAAGILMYSINSRKA